MSEDQTPTSPAPKPGDRVRVNDGGTHHDAVGEVLHRKDDVMSVVKLDGIAGKWLYADDELDVLPAVPATQDADATPTNPDLDEARATIDSTPYNLIHPDLYEQLSTVLQDQLNADWAEDSGIAHMDYFGERAANAALAVVAPVLEGLRAELGRTRADIEGMTRACAVLIVDANKERESRIAWALEADRLQQIALQAVAKLEKLRDEQLDRDPGHECDCEDTGECHAVAAHWAYLRALTAVRPATRPASDVPGLNTDCTADEAACAHGQTADLTGLAAREDQS